MIERPAGAVNAAATPLTKRVAISSVPSSTRPPRAEATANTPSEIEEHAPAAEQVGGAAAEQQEAAVAEHVGGDDPLQRAGRHAEVGLDRRQRDADHRDVERVEEQGAAEHEQGEPGPAVERGAGGDRAGAMVTGADTGDSFESERDAPRRTGLADGARTSYRSTGTVLQCSITVKQFGGCVDDAFPTSHPIRL